MGKKAVSKRKTRSKEEIFKEKRSKIRHEAGPSTVSEVNPLISPFLHNVECAKVFKEKFHSRHILECKFVDFERLTKLFEEQNVDTASYIASQGWTDFVKLNRPIYKNLIRVLISNLDVNSMVSWVGKKRVDLSIENWCNTFNIPNVTTEEEESLMSLLRGDIFFRLTGETHLGVYPFIKINQLHQEANVRLTAQIVATVLIPKKGSKEQVKYEEGRLLYAMIYGKQINLAKIIVDRLRSAFDRKSSPICYAMHLMEIMDRAGVNITCVDDEATVCTSAIDHHTLKRLGYKLQHGGWDYVGRGRVNLNLSEESHTIHRDRGLEEEELGEDTAAHEHSTPFPTESAAPPSSHPRSSRSIPLSLLSNLATKSEVAHLQNFMAEQFQLLQATVLSKLDSMDSRLQTCEEYLLRRHPPTSPLPPHHDPKGKAPMASLAHSHHSPSHIPSPHVAPTSHHPDPVPHSSSPPSPPLSPSHYAFVARTPQPPPQSTSPDSEATHSDPLLSVPIPPSSPVLPPVPTDAPTPIPPPAPLRSSPPPKTVVTPYQRRKKPPPSAADP